MCAVSRKRLRKDLKCIYLMVLEYSSVYNTYGYHLFQYFSFVSKSGRRSIQESRVRTPARQNYLCGYLIINYFKVICALNADLCRTVVTNGHLSK